MIVDPQEERRQQKSTRKKRKTKKNSVPMGVMRSRTKKSRLLTDNEQKPIVVCLGQLETQGHKAGKA